MRLTPSLIAGVLLALVCYISAQSCDSSDALLLQQRELYCGSMVGWTASWCPSTEAITNAAKHDWPSQTVYFGQIMKTLESSQTCVNTSYAADTAQWLNVFQSNLSLGGSLLQTWASPTGQPNYYEMPRHPGERIESPWTLGMKCWAFSYLVQTWNPATLVSHLAQGNLSVPTFVANYEAAMPYSMTICEEVMANCFLNETYTPSRNGTCPLSILDFKAGFDWQNLIHGNVLKYPFFG